MNAWVQLVRAHAHLVGSVEKALGAQGFPPLRWYDVLLELERRDAPMRAHELQGELLLEQYNLSRLLDRMEAKALIARVPDPDDGRSKLVSPTPEGRSLRKRMWPVYLDAVSRAVEGVLDQEQVEQLADLLRRLASQPEQGRKP
jgi:DNA-binding MarR family transcriptional regulator